MLLLTYVRVLYGSHTTPRSSVITKLQCFVSTTCRDTQAWVLLFTALQLIKYSSLSTMFFANNPFVRKLCAYDHLWQQNSRNEQIFGCKTMDFLLLCTEADAMPFLLVFPVKCTLLRVKTLDFFRGNTIFKVSYSGICQGRVAESVSSTEQKSNMQQQIKEHKSGSVLCALLPQF